MLAFDERRESLNNLTPPDVYFGRPNHSKDNEKGSNEKHSKPGACNTANSPHRAACSGWLHRAPERQLADIGPVAVVLAHVLLPRS